MNSPQRLIVERRDAWLRRWATRSLCFLAIGAALAVAHAALAAISGLVIPLIVSFVVATLFAPLTDRLERFVPRALAAGLVLVMLSAVSAGAVLVTVEGVIDQAPEIGRRLAAGIEQVGDWFNEQEWTLGDSELVVDDLGVMWESVAPGATTYLSTVFSSAAAFAVGTLVSLFLLFFALKDWPQLTRWAARNMLVAEDVGRDIIDDATWSLRQYFIALTISSFIVAVIVGAAVAILGLPLAGTIAVVTFATSYIPFLGATLAGAFAVLIALGSGGFTDAAIILVVVLVAQNLVQTIVQTRLTAGALKLHPIVVFGSTIAGGAVFGLLGAALSTPLVAIGISVSKRLDASPSHERHPP